MTMYEIIFRVSYDGLNCSLTSKFSSMKMLFWCNRQHDIVEVMVSDPEERSLLSKGVPKPEGIVAEQSDGRGFYLITKPCSCLDVKMGVIKAIADLNILYVSPGMAEKGWEYHRIVAFRHEDWEKVVRRLQRAAFKIEVLRKVIQNGFVASSLTFDANALFSDLTDKQVDALLTAHRFGYFSFPRRVNVKTIAAKRHVPRTTFSDNLKKAENKLVTSLVPYIQLFSHSAGRRQSYFKISGRDAK